MFNKYIFSIYCIILLTTQTSLFSAPPTNVPSPNWQTNFDDALQRAKHRQKAVLIFFTGSDWCSWCSRLEDESLNTPEFIAATANRFILVKLDFPLYSNQDPQTKAFNKQLQQRFNVRSFPTIVLFDPQQNQVIGTTGYRPGGGRQYADYLIKMLNDYSTYKQKMGALDKTPLSGQTLKTLYGQAKQLELKQDAKRIIDHGLHSELAQFFLIERYRNLAAERQLDSPEAVALREKLLAADPNNAQQTSYQLAVIEYESYGERQDSKDYSADEAIAPLVAYIEKYGPQDKKNLWRLQMIISQVYLDKNELSNALKYAQYAYESAPSTVQADLAKAVQNIRVQMHAPLISKAH